MVSREKVPSVKVSGGSV